MWFLNNMVSSIFIDGKGMTSKKMNKYKNIQEFQNVFVQLVNEALQRYTIENLPESCNERVVLESLLWYGSVCFFEKAGQILALPGTPSADFTLYGAPTKAIVYGRNGYNETIKLYIPDGDNSALVRQNTFGGTEPIEGSGVWVRENYMVYPFIYYVMEYAEKIADTYRTLDITRANIKRPYVITAEESIINSVKEFFNKRDNNESYIISSGVFPADKINILPFDQNPENIRDCTGLIDFYFAKFRELEAISASPATIDKKAEITIPELNQNAGAQDATINTVKNVLEPELDFANKCLGTNMKFVSNIKEYEDKEKEAVEQAESEVENDVDSKQQ